MHLTKEDIEQTNKIKRLNIINSVSGIKPGNLIGTQSNDGDTNLAIFSSVVHLGSNPAYLGFFVRPDKEVRRHTYENVKENACFTINHIHSHFYENAHYTSAKFAKDVSEFEVCGLREEYLFDFKAPFVKESKLKMAMKLVEIVPIESTQTVLLVGEIQHLIIPDNVMDAQGYIDLSGINDVGISGLNSYYKLNKIKDLPYARVKDVPDFD